MEKLPKYRELVERLIKEYGQYKPRYGEIEVQTIFDREQDRPFGDMRNRGYEKPSFFTKSLIHHQNCHRNPVSCGRAIALSEI